MALTKADIVDKIVVGTQCVKKEAIDTVEVVLAIIKATLESGENVKISGFGTFEVKQKADRIGRNPQTGESITIGARRSVTFKSSNKIRDAINKD